MHASGNDFIVIDNRLDRVQGDPSGFVKMVCRQHYSVGADGVILIEKSDKADFKWRFFNLDGGEVAMCGNGSRCAARFAYLKGIAGRELAFETLAGIIRAEVMGERVKVQLTTPGELREGISIDLGGQTREASFIDTGVPHVVFIVEDPYSINVQREGSLTRHHEQFMPAGTNANFAKVTGRDQMTVRTYERGVEGETLACGTGATASALVAAHMGLVDSPVTLTTKGGDSLKVYFNMTEDGFAEVFLEGDAVLVFQGELEEGALI